MNTPNPQKQVVAAGYVPETAIENAKLVIVSEGSWLILTDTRRCNIGHTFAPISPDLPCAIVDVSSLDWSLDGAIADLMGRHTTTEHGALLDGHVKPLADALVELGGTFYPTVQDYLNPPTDGGKQEKPDA